MSLDLTQATSSKANQHVTLNKIAEEIDSAMNDTLSINFTEADAHAITVTEEEFLRHSVFVVTDSWTELVYENVLTFPEISRGPFTIFNKTDNILRARTASQAGGSLAEHPFPEMCSRTTALCACDGGIIIRCNSELLLPIYIEQPVGNKVEWAWCNPHKAWLWSTDGDAGDPNGPKSTCVGEAITPPSGTIAFKITGKSEDWGVLLFNTNGEMTCLVSSYEGGRARGFSKNETLKITSPADVRGIGGVSITMVLTY